MSITWIQKFGNKHGSGSLVAISIIRAGPIRRHISRWCEAIDELRFEGKGLIKAHSCFISLPLPFFLLGRAFPWVPL